MFNTLKNAWRIPDLRKKLLYTLLIIIAFRFGSVVPVPFLNVSALNTLMASANETALGYINMLTGGAFANATLFAMGITPYINSSIIIQLLTVAIPALERMAKEGEEGRKKIAAITRYTTVGLGLIQGTAYYFYLRNNKITLYNEGFSAVFTAIIIVLTFTAGTALIMWMGEHITQKGVGNGISIILFAGIVSRGPSLMRTLVNLFQTGTSGIVSGIAMIIVGLAIVVFIVYMSNAERRIPVQYAKRVVGRKMYGGQSTYIPMKINSTGVMPLILGFAILQFPATIFAFFPTSGINVWWQGFQSGIWYQVVLAVLIIAFTYFYTSITFNPVDISKNMQQNGGIIPGIRQGRATSDFLSRVSGRLTLFSALFLAVLATIPTMLTRIFGITAPFGASSVLIAVSVGIETIRQVEAQMVMRHHKGFLG